MMIESIAFLLGGNRKSSRRRKSLSRMLHDKKVGRDVPARGNSMCKVTQVTSMA